MHVSSENSHCKQVVSKHLGKVTIQVCCSVPFPYYLPWSAISRCFTNITEKLKINRENKFTETLVISTFCKSLKQRINCIRHKVKFSICIKPTVFVGERASEKGAFKENPLLLLRFSFNCSITSNNINYIENRGNAVVKMQLNLKMLSLLKVPSRNRRTDFLSEKCGSSVSNI